MPTEAARPQWGIGNYRYVKAQNFFVSDMTLISQFQIFVCKHSNRKIFASLQPVLPGDHRDVEPPDPIPNSEVKRVIADGSVGSPHVRVGHRQAFNSEKPALLSGLFFVKSSS